MDVGQWVRFYRGHRRLQRFILDEIVALPAELADEGAPSAIVEGLSLQALSPPQYPYAT